MKVTLNTLTNVKTIDLVLSTFDNEIIITYDGEVVGSLYADSMIGSGVPEKSPGFYLVFRSTPHRSLDKNISEVYYDDKKES